MATFFIKINLDIHMQCSDEGVHWAVQNGLQLSRSTVVYFKHNDMASLASTLEKLTHGNKRTEKIRRYIVVEAIYQVCSLLMNSFLLRNTLTEFVSKVCLLFWIQNSGQIAPLDEIVRLKEKYRFRVILEESHSFGVLGKSGRGLAEHYGVPVSAPSHFFSYISTTANLKQQIKNWAGIISGSVDKVQFVLRKSSLLTSLVCCTIEFY